MEVEDCSLYTSHQASPQLLISSRKPQSYGVKFLTSPSPKIHRFSFVYKVAGEQWSVAPATLVCRLWVNSEVSFLAEWRILVQVTERNSCKFPQNSPPLFSSSTGTYSLKNYNMFLVFLVYILLDLISFFSWSLLVWHSRHFNG